MATIKRFEEIESWKVARDLTGQIYAATKNGAFAHDYGLKDQIQRAAVSIMSNIAEGFERGGNREFANFLSIAKGSCGEVRAQLYVALDQNYVTRDDFERLVTLSNLVSTMLYHFIASLNRASVAGIRFKKTPQVSD